VRVGVIGCGSIGRRHIRNILSLGHEVIAHDWDSSLILRRDWPLNATFTKSFPDALTVDALLICTPAATHAQVARRALGHSYCGPAFVEKPLALSVDECAVFREWPSPVTMVGYNLRFQPTARFFKSVGGWTAGAFYCECDNGKYGNDIFELSHEIDLALWLGVKPMPWGLHGHAERYWRQWQVWNEQGTGLTADFHAPDALGEQMYVDELAHFLDCAQKNIPTITPFADGIRVVQVCEQALAMAKETA
jgi:predicted dehydrogenase